MKIVRLTAENVKRLKAVEITPDGTVQVITGRNAQGKTSVLDAIWLALGGGAASKGTVRPIRGGEDKASVRLDLGDLVVTRTWTGDKTALTVTAADGAKYNSPQGVLDALIGRLSFDPLEFTRLSARDQVTALLDLVNLDVDLPTVARQRQAAYDQRTEIGRQGKAIGEIPAKVDAPAQEVSTSDLFAEQQAAQEAHRAHLSTVLAAEEATEWRERAESELREAQRVLALRQADEVAALAAVKVLTALPDLAEIASRVGRVDETNRAVRHNAEVTKDKVRKADLLAQYTTLTDKIAALDKTKADALAAAAFPVPGLGFDDDGVTFEGIPFSQASSAEQIRVSLAMAMALNPKLRVIRILDGSLLDADNLALIAEMAADQDFQVWIERVSDASGVGVVIEDGEVI